MGSRDRRWYSQTWYIQFVILPAAWKNRHLWIFYLSNFLLLSFLFFTIAMEEVSWFQRILKIETPEFLKTNEQNEINFHNLYSDISENVYYFGSFVFLIVFPFLNFLFPKCLFSKHLKPIIPKPFVAIIVAVGYSYNFDMWNSIITQITFFSCLIILSYFAYFSKCRIERILVLFSLLLFHFHF